MNGRPIIIEYETVKKGDKTYYNIQDWYQAANE